MTTPERGPGLLERDPRAAFLFLMESMEGVTKEDFTITRVDKDGDSFIVSGHTKDQYNDEGTQDKLDTLFSNTPGAATHGASEDGLDHFSIHITKDKFTEALAA